MTLLLALIACAPSHLSSETLASAKEPGDVELVVDLECADPSCGELFLDASASQADGNGISAYSFGFEDGSGVEEAWAFHAPFASGQEHEVVTLGVEVEGAGEFGMDVPMVHVDGFDPSGGLVWFRPTVVRGSDGEVKYCDLRLEIVGCLTDVSEVRTTRLPSGQERSHSVTSADQKISETAQRLLKGQTLSYRVIKVNGEGETVETEVSISCEPRTLSKTGGGV